MQAEQPSVCSGCGRTYCYGSSPHRLSCGCCRTCFLGECRRTISQRPTSRGRVGDERRDAEEPASKRARRPSRAPIKSNAAAAVTPNTSIGSDIVIALPFDVIRDIFACMSRSEDVWANTMMNTCVALGREEADRLRIAYLRDNEDYVLDVLRPFRPPSSAVQRGGWVSIDQQKRATLDKARDDILAWMCANPNWRDRITKDNLVKWQKFSSTHLHSDLVFNNPSVALWLGLIVVLRYQVEEADMLKRSMRWQGLYDTAYHHDFIRIALVRGDPDIVSYLLDCDDFEFRNPRVLCNVILFIMCSDWAGDVDESCREVFFRHPKVDLDVVHPAQFGNPPRTPLLQSLYDIQGPMRKRSEEAVREKEMLFSAILAILKAGADPFYSPTGNGLYPASLVRKKLKNVTDDANRKIWKQILHLMETLPAKSFMS